MKNPFMPLPVEVSRVMDRTHPLNLRGSGRLWFVAAGEVDIFMSKILEGGFEGSRHHVVRVEAGQLIFGFSDARTPNEASFVAVGGPHTTLNEVSPQALQDVSRTDSGAAFISEQVENWVKLTASKMRGPASPTSMETIVDGATATVAGGSAALQPEAGLIWLSLESGKSLFASVPALELRPGDCVPVPADCWIEPIEDSEFKALSTRSLLGDESLWRSIDAYQKLLEIWSASTLAQIDEDDLARMESKAAAERGAMSNAISNLSTLLENDSHAASDQKPGMKDPLAAACAVIGQALHLPIRTPPGYGQAKRFRDPLAAIAKASRVRLRRVVLNGDWWKQDSGPILAFRVEGGQPVAMVPTSPTSYAMIEPVSDARTDVTDEVAPLVAPVAFTFSRPFPETAISVGRMLKFGFHNTQKDVAMMLGLGFAGGLLGMLPPLMTGILFDSIIPSAARTELLYLAGALLVAGMAGVVFDVIRALAQLRLEAKSDAAVQGAVWDRLLSLPLPFFRDYTSGDLADRANGINAIRAIASGAVLSSVLSGLFSLFSFGLLFYYSIPLAVLASCLVVVYVTVSVIVSLNGLKFQRPICDLHGKISGQVLQFITGITKLRVAGAEVHAYAVWAQAFARQKELHLRATAMYNRFGIFSEAYPILTTVGLFMGVVWMASSPVSTGMFLAFSSAFTTFLYAMLDLSQGIISLLHAVPIYERAKPILTALPEVNEAKADPGELRGRIELSRVSFRYKPDGPWTLRDVSFQILPGQFVAIVGPSGSGKSTLIRLLLGFDKPEAGTISYDGMELSGLDIQSVRKQLGVVLQNGKLMPGDIYQNIVGSSLLSLEAAWEAAESAGLDEDIHAMPMGMHTVLSEGAGTLSGGQRQRLMIARAIVAKPRILIFDEATSALDNRTQSIVSRSLERLQATRIVIAHRLSTIIRADKIIVVKAGAVVQTGTYNELIHQPGPFSELAQRQMA